MMPPSPPASVSRDPRPPHVEFIGAGPGDPGLLTLRAAERLRAADVIVHDGLVPAAVLALADRRARILPAPRDGDDPGAATGRLLVELAAAGRTVARLKGVDPGVFGRLAEEIGPVRAAGIAAEVIPGVTAATAAAAAAGIPLTSRESASSVTILSGHDAGSKSGEIDFIPIAALPGTIVIYMGVDQVGRWSRGLLAAGRDPATPVAIVSHCSWPDQTIATTTLGGCADDFERHAWPAPAVVVIGQVAREAAGGAAGGGPLAGRRVLVTRPAGGPDELQDRLAVAGASCLRVPVIRIAPPGSWEPLDAALDAVDSFDWIVFASGNGVRGFFGRLRDRGRDGRALGTARLAAIGPATRREIEAAGFVCDRVADVHSSEGVVEALAGAGRAAARILLVRANRGRDVMRRELEARGHQVVEVAAYSSVMVDELDPVTLAAVDTAAVDWVTITSSFIAESAARLLGDRLSRWRVASISPVTSAALRRLGIEPAAEAATADAAGLVAAIVAGEATADRPG